MPKTFLAKLLDALVTAFVISYNWAVGWINDLLNLAVIWFAAHKLDRAVRRHGSLAALLEAEPDALNQIFPHSTIEIHDQPE